MDDSIVPRETMRQRGARDFDLGRSIDAHGMNPGSAAIADWRAGYIERRAERRAEHAQSCVEPLLVMAFGATPP